MAEIVTTCLPFFSSLLWLLEVPQIRRRLVLTGRHQYAVAAHEISVLADRDFCCILRAVKLAPIRARIGVVYIFFVDGPRPRQCMVEHRDLVMKNVRVGLVEIEALLEGGLTVEMQR